MCHGSGQGAWTGHMCAEDTTTEACTDDTFVPHSRQYCRDGRTVHETLKVSVMLLSGLVLGTVLVSSRSCVWDVKMLHQEDHSSDTYAHEEHGDGHPCVGAPRRFPFVVHVRHMLVQMR